MKFIKKYENNSPNSFEYEDTLTKFMNREFDNQFNIYFTSTKSIVYYTKVFELIKNGILDKRIENLCDIFKIDCQINDALYITFNLEDIEKNIHFIEAIKFNLI